jgi:hypothetical protein
MQRGRNLLLGARSNRLVGTSLSLTVLPQLLFRLMNADSLLNRSPSAWSKAQMTTATDAEPPRARKRTNPRKTIRVASGSNVYRA